MKRSELKKRDAGVLNEATLFLSAGAIRRRKKINIFSFTNK